MKGYSVWKTLWSSLTSCSSKLVAQLSFPSCFTPWRIASKVGPLGAVAALVAAGARDTSSAQIHAARTNEHLRRISRPPSNQSHGRVHVILAPASFRFGKAPHLEYLAHKLF